MDILSDLQVNKATGFVGTSVISFLNTADGGGHEVADDSPGHILDVLRMCSGVEILVITLAESLDALLGHLLIQMGIHRVLILRQDIILITADVFVVNRNDAGVTRQPWRRFLSITELDCAIRLEIDGVWCRGDLQIAVV